jgi:hypothetical protein
MHAALIQVPGSDVPMHSMTHLAPLGFLGGLGQGIGLAIAAVFLAAAVRLRRYQGPI